MVSVAIIGILASTSIALFKNYQLRSRISEAKTNVASIRDAQKAYFAERSIYVASVACPGLPGKPDPNPQNWKQVRPTFCDPALPSSLGTLGWEPDGSPLFDYESSTNGAGDEPRFTVAAFGDTDGDGAVSIVMYVQPDSAGDAEPCTVCSSLSLPNKPWDPNTCRELDNVVAQMPSTVSCGNGAVADDF